MSELEIDVVDEHGVFARGLHDRRAPARQRKRPPAPIRDLEAENERLRSSSKLQADLVAAVAHELRTPLASVLGFTELLLAGSLEPRLRDRYLRIVNSEARRFRNLVDELCDVQRIADGGTHLALEAVDLVELIERQADLFGAESANHSILLDLPEEPIVVWADRDRITQVVANLLSNAIKYSPEGGIVVIAGGSRDGKVRVSVRDNGIGIPADQHHLVFSRFFRVRNPQTRDTNGAGLGLALSREIVHAHGGALGFASVEDEGSTFWFELRDHAGEEQT